MSGNLQTSTSNTPSTISEEIAELTRRLQWASPDLIRDCLDRLVAGGMEIPPGLPIGKWLDEYRYALHHIPAYGLVIATKKLKRGEIASHRTAFIPLPAQLAHLAREEAEETVADLARLKAKTNAAKATADMFHRQPTEEEERQRERIRTLHADFKANHQAQKARERGTVLADDPIDHESAVYWDRIRQLPDGGDLSAEQKAFQRRIEKEIRNSTPNLDKRGRKEEKAKKYDTENP